MLSTDKAMLARVARTVFWLRNSSAGELLGQQEDADLETFLHFVGRVAPDEWMALVGLEYCASCRDLKQLNGRAVCAECAAQG